MYVYIYICIYIYIYIYTQICSAPSCADGCRFSLARERQRRFSPAYGTALSDCASCLAGLYYTFFCTLTTPFHSALRQTIALRDYLTVVSHAEHLGC